MSPAAAQTVASASGSVTFTYQSASGLPEWLSRDPIGEAGGLNLYAYVDGNQVNWTDPFGLAPGDTYSTWEDAAHAAGQDALKHKKNRNSPERGGKIGERKNSCGGNEFTYGDDAEGADNSQFDLRNAPDLPSGWDDAGYYHSHPKGGPMSPADQAAATPDKPISMSRDQPNAPRGSRPPIETYKSTGPGNVTKVRPVP